MGRVHGLKGSRNKLFDIIDAIAAPMMADRNAASEFFRNTMNARQIPFYLIGYEGIPPEVRANSSGRVQMEWSDWMQTGGENGGYQSMFDDPDALAQVVESRMNLMIDGANEKAGIFFRQRLVIDLLNLVNRTLVGQNITVRQSLQHIDRYLGRFEGRLTNSFSDSVMYGTVLETRSRIKSVLQSFQGLAALGREAVTNPIENYGVDERKAVTDAAKLVIDSVFKELEVLYMSDVFLTNRVSTFIERDFAIRIKQGENMTPYQAQLLKITQDQLIERMTQLYGVNPVSTKDDLAGAHVINDRNLGAVEEIFSDSIYMMLEELNEVVHGRPANAAALKNLTRKRFEKEREVYRASALSTMSFPGMLPQSLYRWFMAGRDAKKDRPDLYIRPTNPNSVSSTEDGNGSYAQFRGRLCAQTLAFQGRERFTTLCKGAVVKSFYSAKGEHSQLDLTYDDYMRPGYNKAIMSDPLKIKKRVCAVNDYGIRNWVRFLEERDRSKDDSSEE